MHGRTTVRRKRYFWSGGSGQVPQGDSTGAEAWRKWGPSREEHSKLKGGRQEYVWYTQKAVKSQLTGAVQPRTVATDHMWLFLFKLIKLKLKKENLSSSVSSATFLELCGVACALLCRITQILSISIIASTVRQPVLERNDNWAVARAGVRDALASYHQGDAKTHNELWPYNLT